MQTKPEREGGRRGGGEVTPALRRWSEQSSTAGAPGAASAIRCRRCRRCRAGICSSNAWSLFLESGCRWGNCGGLNQGCVLPARRRGCGERNAPPQSSVCVMRGAGVAEPPPCDRAGAAGDASPGAPPPRPAAGDAAGLRGRRSDVQVHWDAADARGRPVLLQRPWLPCPPRGRGGRARAAARCGRACAAARCGRARAAARCGRARAAARSGRARAAAARRRGRGGRRRAVWGAGAGSVGGGCGQSLFMAGPAAPVEGSVAGSKVVDAQAEADRIRRRLQDAGRGQGGFAMKGLDEIVVGVAAVSSNSTSSPLNCTALIRIRRVLQIRMLQTSLQS